MKWSAPMPTRSQWCRSPCGERGLKYFKADKQHPAAVSLPVRGAWVEIALLVDEFPPVRRSPCGERGLKFDVWRVDVVHRVAPRAGSVG